MKLRFATTLGLIALFVLAACTTATLSPTVSLPPAPTVPAVTITPQATLAPTVTPIPSPTLPPSPRPPVPTSEAAPGSVITDSQHGLTITITSIQFSSTETLINYEAAVDPRWGFTFEKFDTPPQQVFASSELPNAVLVDETGKSYAQRGWMGMSYPENRIDPETHIAYTGGRFTFEPVTGQEFDLQLKFGLFTVRADAPIQFDLANLEVDQTLSILPTLTFGELTAEVKSANWLDGNTFELTTVGIEHDGLILNCLYVYTDPTRVPHGYEGCFIPRTGVPDDRSARMIFDPLPLLSNPVEVKVAADIDLTEPFVFKWIRMDQ